jgi:hypothetical protein
VNCTKLQSQTCSSVVTWNKFEYPYQLAPRGTQIDEYTLASGDKIEVMDPYRFLEDPDSAQTQQWIAA